jgi:A/G-specific adenine glycosylase
MPLARQMLDPDKRAAFQSILLRWYRSAGRRFPWRRPPRSAYTTLVAEVMLRKTTARNVAAVFDQFIRLYPSPEALSRAKEDELSRMIRPLGIADRARLLRATADALVQKHGGQVPNSERELRALPGVGRYTAAAVRCFAFGESEGIVDTNVVRVISRVFSVSSCRGRPHTDPAIWVTANYLVSPDRPAAYNRALLDFGGTVCTLRHPKCVSCPLSSLCDYFIARNAGATTG